MRRSKIFGIGLSRTGTTSLTEALKILGFTAIHYPTSLQEIELYDAATDLPVADAFEMLDGKFPGSKFIYTVRERQRWLESCRRHWTLKQEKIDCTKRELRQRLYGTVNFDLDLFAQAYDRHESRVLSYFVWRPYDLLVLDIFRGRTDWGCFVRSSTYRCRTSHSRMLMVYTRLIKYCCACCMSSAVRGRLPRSQKFQPGTPKSSGTARPFGTMIVKLR
jgi:Sulfotransferase domain